MRSNSHKLGEMVTSLNDIVEQTYYFEQKLYEWGKKVAENKSKINKAMGRKQKLEVKVDNDTAFSAVKNVQTNIEFFPDKLKSALEKEIFNKITKKTVVVNNLDGLIEMLKGYGVPAKEFKKFITVESEIDIEAVDNLIEMEEIKIEDINGCYKVDFEENIKVLKTK